MSPASSHYDAIVIGGGHNGLTAGAYLAQQGRRVLILEQSDVLGGMAKSQTLASGGTMPRFAHLAYGLSPKVIDELKLSSLAMRALPTTHLSPDGNHIEVSDQGARFVSGETHPQSAAYQALRNRIRSYSESLAPVMHGAPPDIDAGLGLSALRDLLPLANAGLKLRRQGKEEMREFMRILLLNAYDFILDELEDGPLAGGFAADAVLGAWAGPRSPGTVYALLHRYAVTANATVPVGGMDAIVRALSDSATDQGATIQTNARVQSITVSNDRVTGVVLEDGSSFGARAVLSSVGPMPSMQLAGKEHFDIETVRRIRHVRSKGTTAKVNLQLKEAPVFTGLDTRHVGGRMLIAPSVQYLENAFNAVKYRRLPDAPVIEAVAPSAALGAPANSPATLSLVVQYIPYHLDGGWTDEARTSLSDSVINTLASYAPGIEDTIIESELLTPVDIEAETNAPGGHWHHEELNTDQLLTVRPINGMARYQFGVGGLYLCGASAHPGGDVSGIPGRNSAKQLIRDGGV